MVKHKISWRNAGEMKCVFIFTSTVALVNNGAEQNCKDVQAGLCLSCKYFISRILICYGEGVGTYNESHLDMLLFTCTKGMH